MDTDKLKPTSKQRSRIARIVEHVGLDFVKRYFCKHFPRGDFDNMTRKQAQKIITGLDYCLPKKPIYGVWNNYSWM